MAGCTGVVTVLTTVLVLAQSLVPVASVYLMKLIVDAVTASASGGSESSSFGGIVLLIVIAGSVALASRWARSMDDRYEERAIGDCDQPPAQSDSGQSR